MGYRGRVGIVNLVGNERVPVLVVYINDISRASTFACLVVIKEVVAGNDTVAYLVDIAHITMSFALAGRAVVFQIVAFHIAFFRCDSGISGQFHAVVLAVIVAVVGLYNLAVAASDCRRTGNMGYVGACIIVQIVRIYRVFRTAHHHILIKIGLMRIEIIFSTA